MCEKEFRKYRMNYKTSVKSGELENTLSAFGLKTVDDLVANVGYGKITPLQIIRKIQPKLEPEQETETPEIKTDPRPEKRPRAGVVVKGIDDILVRFGKCCRPVPGDSITGYITRGYGITVHKVNCMNALKINPERRIDVEWNETTIEDYPVQIRVRSRDRVHLLADLAENISKNGANILSVNSGIRDNDMVDSYFTLAVKDTKHLNRILSSLKRVKLVADVRRIDR